MKTQRIQRQRPGRGRTTMAKSKGKCKQRKMYTYNHKTIIGWS
jgi:hypothetical protein